MTDNPYDDYIEELKNILESIKTLKQDVYPELSSLIEESGIFNNRAILDEVDFNFSKFVENYVEIAETEEFVLILADNIAGSYKLDLKNNVLVLLEEQSIIATYELEKSLDKYDFGDVIDYLNNSVLTVIIPVSGADVEELNILGGEINGTSEED